MIQCSIQPSVSRASLPIDSFLLCLCGLLEFLWHLVDSRPNILCRESNVDEKHLNLDDVISLGHGFSFPEWYLWIPANDNFESSRAIYRNQRFHEMDQSDGFPFIKSSQVPRVGPSLRLSGRSVVKWKMERRDVRTRGRVK